MSTFFPWKRALYKKTVWFSLLVIAALGLVALLAPWIAPHDPFKRSLTATETSLPPMWVKNPFKPGMAKFPLGTDYYGRDVLSRLIYGTRTAFFLAFSAVSLAALIGTMIGLMTGYMGGRFDSWMMLFIEMIQSLPGIMFMVIIVIIFRSLLTPTWFHGLITLVIGFAAVGWVSLARLIRINVLLLKPRVFIEAATSLGASRWYIIVHHLLPNVLHVVLFWVINYIPAVILLEAVLGYIGVGVTGAIDGGEFTVVSWGGMFFSGRSAMSRNPLMLIIPSFCILLMSMSFILLANFINETSRRQE
jgi:peptide/nickel transport system permease protein